MRKFAALYAAIDETTSTSRKIAAMREYFSTAPAEDAAWAVYFLAGGKPRQIVPNKLLRQFALEHAGIPDWLFEECLHAVGDFAETISHLLPPPGAVADLPLSVWMEHRIMPLRGAPPEAIREAMMIAWAELEPRERFILLKIIGGAFRVGVSRLLVTRALAEVAGASTTVIAERLMGWTDGRVSPQAEHFRRLLANTAASEDDPVPPGNPGQPYPFFLAHPLQAPPETLGDPGSWLVEWKYDGIRAQLIRRQGQTWLWSRGEDLITERFPEIASIPLPDGTVVDGEIVIWKEGRAAPFALLQQRIGRKTLSAAMRENLPATLIAYDLLEHEGQDLRALAQEERRRMLEQLHARMPPSALQLSPLVSGADWLALQALREESRARGVEGFMLKARDSRYGIGRTKEKGVWWKWKVDPYAVDAVLVYAQPGNGRRASLLTDYTFAVWDTEGGTEARLVPFAKAYSGLTDAEIAEVDAILRRTTLEKFGPVRSVQPSMVFEIGFEGISASPRHKSGIAVRFPRILRWRQDKRIEEADTLATLRGLLA
jgi:DNA ligase 1